MNHKYLSFVLAGILALLILVGVVCGYIFLQHHIHSNNSVSSDMVGVWQNAPTMAAGWGTVYQFFPSGKFNYRISSMDCASRDRGYSGYWKLDQQNHLILTLVSNVHIVGGTENAAAGSCGTAFMIDGGKTKEENLSTQTTQAITLAQCQTNDSLAYGPKDCLSINGTRFYRFSDNPNDQELPGEPDFVLVGFGGTWRNKGIGSSGEYAYSMTLEEDGDYLNGKYCFTVNNGNHSDCDPTNSVTGFISGKTARVYFLGGFANSIYATLALATSTLDMKLDSPNRDVNEVFPAEIVFTKTSVSGQTYTNAMYHYEVQYPDTWTKSLNATATDVMFYPKGNKMFPNNPTDPSFTVKVLDATKGTTDYNSWIQSITFDRYVSLTSVGDFQFGSIAAHQYMGIFHGANDTVSFRNVYAFQNASGSIFYALILDDFDSTNFTETLHQILSSFRFIDSNQGETS